MWDAALDGKHGVISTPQILLDALSHGFVSLESISLLVIDEAHHGNKGHPTNITMQLFYHPLKERDPTKAPHILALTASPMNSDNLALIAKLEQNLHAVCRAPTEYIEESERYVHLPQLVRLDYSITPGTNSKLLPRLEEVVQNYKIENDPQYKRYRCDDTLEGMNKFEEIKRKKTTSILKHLKELLTRAGFMYESLGSWATDHYISACVTKAIRRTTDADEWLFTVSDEEKLHLQSTLKLIVSEQTLAEPIRAPKADEISLKVKVFTAFLEHNFVAGSAWIVFAQRRSTVWALKEILDRCLSLSHIRMFTFVGANNMLRNTLADLADGRIQDQDFAEFRSGERDVALATNVMEEGLDFQACATVVSFDPPDNVRSSIQRRGRARHEYSKFVILHDVEEKTSKYGRWDALEKMMKEDYTTRKRRLEDLEAKDAVVEDCDRILRVEATNAVLTTRSARSHLHYFCATLPRRTGRPESSPIYILERIDGIGLSCKVILPPSLPADLQLVNSLYCWQTESSAKKDAAFVAVKKLYKAGLINDNLLPPVVEKPQDRQSAKDEDSINEIPSASNPWAICRQAIRCKHPLYAHHLWIIDSELTFPEMLLLLPTKLLHTVDCRLYMSAGIKSIAHIKAVDGALDWELLALTHITKFLFGSTLSRRLPNLNSDEYEVPYFVIPDIPPHQLESWLRQAQEIVALSELKPEREVEYLVRQYKETNAYFYVEGDEDNPMNLRETIQATKLSRRLDLQQAPAQVEGGPRTLQVSECIVSKLPAAFVKFIACMPTIMHQVELVLRAHMACESPLKSIQFQNMKHVVSAMTAPSASKDNFQRLEYLGDSLLKFYSTINVFCNNLRSPESQLTFLREKIICNARLQQTTMELGLDAYLSTKRFSGHEWTLHEKPLQEDTRKVSSKTLADVIEALIGAAYVDTAAPETSRDTKVLKALSLFIPEHSWKPTSDELTKLLVPPSSVQPLPQNERLSHIEQILKYTFRNRILLAEALTHSTVQVGIQSYERFEFLGDAVIDVIVKEVLFTSAHEFNEGDMHTRHIGLVNKEIFAYLTTKNGVDFEESVVTTNLRTLKPEVTTQMRRKCIHDFVVKTSSDGESGNQKAHFLAHYFEVLPLIERALTSGSQYPWSELYHLNSPKWCSDVLESLIGAIFIDSGGNLQTCSQVLRHLGLMHLVERAATDQSVDFEQPIRKVRELFPPNRLKVDVKRFKVDQWACRIKIDGEVRALVRGCTCEAEAESRAAEVVLEGIANEEVEGDGGDGKDTMEESKRDGEVDGMDDELMSMDADGEELDADDIGALA